jgi:hypothetical protein
VRHAPTDKAARVAGAVYLSMALTASSASSIFPHLIVQGNATATANNILAHETLFRLGIVADLITAIILSSWEWSTACPAANKTHAC